MIDFLRTVVLSSASKDVRTEALERLINEVAGSIEIKGLRVSMNVVSRIRMFMSQNRKIMAIKVLREVTGLGLKEANTAVEDYMAANPIDANVD